ncbi:hypothetical protein B0J13DRAFT_572179 [Dactylonectria estremocensis]|uniref:Uncharacterized protein n=1 Tax=Dactylonectria estremocensis TaxID=1079267 RepID=A0A9P9DA36_9HYPO|nr:hypothetical protein B0J13DRAFT_572179 [Dactylonectria estremocensis]
MILKAAPGPFHNPQSNSTRFNIIMPLLLRGPIRIDCNYLMPQTRWKDIFLQIPFLWDLDREVIASKPSSVAPEGKEWNWEKLARQVLSPPKVATVKENRHDYRPWDYKDVGLVVPSGFTNRRRIWQICEDMSPNDVGMEHRPYQPPSNDEDLKSFDGDSDSSDHEE